MSPKVSSGSRTLKQKVFRIQALVLHDQVHHHDVLISSQHSCLLAELVHRRDIDFLGGFNRPGEMPAQSGPLGGRIVTKAQHHRALGFIHAIQAGQAPQAHHDRERP